jgi:hypothetical protein
VQRELVRFFLGPEDSHQLHCFPEQRLHVQATRFRVPNLCVWTGEPEDEVLETPLLLLEILSPSDTIAEFEDRIAE